MVMEYY
jgi:hypothetical protein